MSSWTCKVLPRAARGQGSQPPCPTRYHWLPDVPPEQGRKIFTQSCEEKLRQNRELLPSLRTALQEDSNVLDFVLKVPAGPSCCAPAWCWACTPNSSRSWQHRPAKNAIPRLTVAIPLSLPCPQYNKLPIKDAFGEGHELVSATENLEVTAGLQAGDSQGLGLWGH